MNPDAARCMFDSMCTNCVSAAEAAIVQAAFVGYVMKGSVERALARCGFDVPDPITRDVRTIAFLRSLELDPVPILGAEIVTTADRWVPAERRQPTGVRSRRRLASSALPIGSHSLLTAQ